MPYATYFLSRLPLSGTCRPPVNESFFSSLNGSLAPSLTWVDHQGISKPLAAAAQAYGPPRISPDGQRLAVPVAGATDDVWVYEFARATFTRLTVQGSNYGPQWTLDGRRIVYRRSGPNQFEIVRKLADGSGAEEVLATSKYPWSPESWALVDAIEADLGSVEDPFDNCPDCQAAHPDDGRSLSFQAGCIWADESRRDTFKDTYEYHFINISNMFTTLDLARDCAPLDCAVVGIQRNARLGGLGGIDRGL